MLTRILPILVLVTMLSADALGALSPEYANFAKGPLELLLTKEEKRAWENVRTDEEAKAFIALFWARRDPTPGTPVNEFRDDVDARIAAADQRFGTPAVPGSQSDRGKTLVVMGPPTSIRRSGTPAGGTVQRPTTSMPATASGAGVQNYGSREMWTFEQGKIDAIKLGQPVAQVGFLDQYNSNEWKRERVQGTDYPSLFERVAAQYIKQPDLKEVPRFAAAAPMPAAAVAATPSSIRTEALIAAVAAARAATTPSDTLHLTWGEYITADGVHFVPVQLYATRAAGLAAGASVTFFGRVEPAAGGTAVVEFEEPVTLTASSDAFVYGRSLTLAPGSYHATFGFARDGKPVAIVSRPLTVEGLQKGTPSVSQLILSNNVYALPEAQRPTDPYAFGGLKVVPKGDAVFRQSDDLSYFLEARNPGIDPATSQPNMTMKLLITGKTTEGQNSRRAGAAAAATATPVNGVPGHFALGQAMPLATFKPGDYTITVQVKDVVLDKTYERKENFRVVP